MRCRLQSGSVLHVRTCVALPAAPYSPQNIASSTGAAQTSSATATHLPRGRVGSGTGFGQVGIPRTAVRIITDQQTSNFQLEEGPPAECRSGHTSNKGIQETDDRQPPPHRQSTSRALATEAHRNCRNRTTLNSGFPSRQFHRSEAGHDSACFIPVRRCSGRTFQPVAAKSPGRRGQHEVSCTDNGERQTGTIQSADRIPQRQEDSAIERMDSAAPVSHFIEAQHVTTACRCALDAGRILRAEPSSRVFIPGGG